MASLIKFDRTKLMCELSNYETSFLEELEFVKRFLELLAHPDAYDRNHLPGHITGSSWIVDPTRQFVLLTHHAKLNRWLQPGGHADGDEDVLAVALREAQEETGIENIRLLKNNIFDIDIHIIPQRKEFPAHFHYDIRFLFEAFPDDKVTITQESLDVAWINIMELENISENNLSMIRMAKKGQASFD